MKHAAFGLALLALASVLSGCGGFVRDLWALGECAIHQNDINKRCQ